MVLIIAAAGKGSRFKEKKQFIKIKDIFIINLIVKKFLDSAPFEIAIATKKEDFNRTLNILSNFKEKITLVEGGSSRQESVKNAFLNCHKNHSDGDIVLIHDAARPFFSIDAVKKLIDLAKEKKAATLACPIVDTIKYIEKNSIKKTLDRSHLFAAQTPQAFQIGLYKKALSFAEKNNIKVTDDCQLIELLNHPIYYVKSSKTNFKITTPDDLKYAEFLMEEEIKKCLE